MSCGYNYKGKEYKDRESLKEAILANVPTSLPDIQTDNRIKINNEWSKEKIIGDAETFLGTTEFLSFTEEEGEQFVSINEEALNDIAGSIKTFYRENGETVEIDVDKLYADLQANKNQNILNIDGVTDTLLIKVAELHKEHLLETAKNNKQTPEQLKEKLIGFLNKLGVSITAIQNYIDNFGEVGSDVEALADIGNKLVALSNDNDIRALSEEVSHFAIEWMDDTRQVDKMLETVNQTSEYKANSLRYRIKYAKRGLKGDALERKVRKEVLGKILMNKIIDNFSEANTINSTEIGITNILKELWNRFLELFKITDGNKKFFRDFGKTIDDIAQSVIKQDVSAFKVNNSKEVYFSLTDEKSKRLREKLTEYSETLKDIYRNTINNPTKREKLNRISAIEDAITDADFLSSVQGFIVLLKNDIEKAKERLYKAREENPNDPFSSISDVDFINIQTAEHTLVNNLDLLQTILNNDIEVNDVNKEDIELLNKEIDVARTVYAEIKRPLNALLKVKMSEGLDKWMNNANVPPVLQEEFKKGLDTIDDVSFISRWLKSPMFMGNIFVQYIRDIVYQAQKVAEEKTMKYVRDVEEYLKRHTQITNKLVNKLRDGYYMINGLQSAYYNDYYYRKQEQSKVYDELRINLTSKEDIKEYDTDRHKANILLRAKWEESSHKLEYIQDRSMLMMRTVDDDGERVYGDLIITADGKKAGEVIRNQNGKITILNELNKEETIEQNEDILSVDGFNGIHPQAKNVISAYNASKYRILSKYVVGGRVRLSAIKKHDLEELEMLATNFKKEKSLYTETGLKKSGLSLAIAEGINKHYNKRNKGETFEKPTDAQLREFELERQIVAQRDPQGYERWERVFGQYTYSDEIFELMESDGMEVDGTVPLDDFDKKVIYINLGVKKDENGEYPEISSTDLYDMLKKKKASLLAPYKKVGLYNQLMGNIIEGKPALIEEVEKINRLMAKFKMKPSKEKELKFEAVANDDFKKRYDSLEKGTEEYYKFINKHAQRNSNGGIIMEDGYPVPSSFYYRTYNVYKIDGEGNKIERVGLELKPSYVWLANKDVEIQNNPDFSRELSEKGVVQASRWKKQEYKNEEFFDTFGINSENDFYGQGVATRNKELFGLRQLLLEQKNSVDKKNTDKQNYFILPSVPPTGKEIYLSKSPIEGIKSIRGTIRKTFFLDTADEETGITEEATEGKGGKFGVEKREYKNKLVQRYRNPLIKTDENGYKSLDDSLLSQDLTFMYMSYVGEAILTNERSGALPKVGMTMDSISRTPLTSNKTWSESNLKKVMDSFLASNLYGQNMDSGYIVSIFGKKLSTTKLSRAIYNYAQITNLGLNLPVALTGLMNSTMQIIAEKYINYNVSKESVNFGFSKAHTLLPEYVKDVGKLNPESELAQLLRFSQMDTSFELNKGMSDNRIYRSFGDSMTMTPLAMTSKYTAAISLLAVMDSYRLGDVGYHVILNGVSKSFATEQLANEYASKNGGEVARIRGFLTEREFIQRQRDILGDSYNEEKAMELYKNSKELSFYNFLKTNPTTKEKYIDKEKLEAEGFFKGFEDKQSRMDATQSMIIRAISAYHAEKEGKLSMEEKASIHRDAIFSHMMLHRGWLVRQIHQRTMSRHFNTLTGLEEEGSYNTLFRLTASKNIKQIAEMYASALTLGYYSGGFEGLSELEKSNMRRITMDIMLVIAASSIAMLLSSLAGDDEEDSALLAFASYIATRNLNEILSTQLPFVLSELSAIVKDPVPGIGMAEGLLLTPYNVAEGIITGKEVSSGNYKGMPTWKRDLIKATFIKNINGASNAENWKGKETWLRNQSYFMSNLYKLIEEED